MSQRDCTPLDTPFASIKKKQQVVLWVTQRQMSYSKVGTLFFNGSKFVSRAYRNYSQASFFYEFA